MPSSVVKPVALHELAAGERLSCDVLIAWVTAGCSRSRKSVDLPAPLGPATMISRPSGRRRSKPFRLRKRAPVSSSQSRWNGAGPPGAFLLQQRADRRACGESVGLDRAILAARADERCPWRGKGR